MKQFLIKSTVISFVLAFLLSGCINPFSSSVQEDGLSDLSTGNLTVRVASSDLGARTVQPDFISSIYSYQIYGTGPNDSELTPQPIGIEDTIEGLVLGSWSFVVEVLDDEDNVLARGDTTTEITSGPNIVSIALEFLQQGTGNYHIEISWPETADIDTMQLSIDDTEYDPVPTMDSRINLGGSIESGNHVMVLRLMSESLLRATVVEAIQVFDNQTSIALIELGSPDISIAPAVPISLTAKLTPNEAVELRWDSSEVLTETNYIIERDTDQNFSNPLVIAEPTANIEDYTDISVTTGMTYFYRIASTNCFGVSSWSEVASLLVPTVGDPIWAYEASTFRNSSAALSDEGILYFLGTAEVTDFQSRYEPRLHSVNTYGDEQWVFPMGRGNSLSALPAGVISSAPAIGEDGTIYVGTEYGEIYAVNPDGTERWSASIGRIESSPAVAADGTVYVGIVGGPLKAVNPDGTIRWTNDIVQCTRSSPAIAHDGTIYVGGYPGYIFALDSEDGNIKWSNYLYDVCESSPAIASNGTVYMGGQISGAGGLYALDPSDGSTLWSIALSRSSSNPVIGSDDTVYFVTESGVLYAIDPLGNEVWNTAFGGPGTFSSPAIGEDGTIFVAGANNDIHAFNSDGNEKWVVTTGSEIASSPVIGDDGTVYIASEDGTLYAIKDDCGGPMESSWSMFGRDSFNTASQMDVTMYTIGEPGPAGGIVFYDKGLYSEGWRYMEAAPAGTEWVGVPWDGRGTLVGGTNESIGSGPENTLAIVMALSHGNNAASLCDLLEYGGYDDWFLPSKTEMDEMLDAIFISADENTGGFSAYVYWTSSEMDAHHSTALYPQRSMGRYYSPFKDTIDYDESISYWDMAVRAARRF